MAAEIKNNENSVRHVLTIFNNTDSTRWGNARRRPAASNPCKQPLQRDGVKQKNMPGRCLFYIAEPVFPRTCPCYGYTAQQVGLVFTPESLTGNITTYRQHKGRLDREEKL